MIFSLYTDGACQPNPGTGGWAFIAYMKGHPKGDKIVKTGFEKDTTNNRMEITAVLEGLKFLVIAARFTDISNGEENKIELFSDSKYILNGIESWMEGWQKRGWIKKDKKPVLNADLWKQIFDLSQEITIHCNHIKGHSGHPENEECDKLAVQEILQHKDE